MLSSPLCDSNLTRPICYPPESQSYRSTKTRLYVTSSSKHGGHYCVANDKCYNILLKCSLLVQRVLLASSPHEPFWIKDQEICWGKRSILHVNTGLKQLELLWSRCSLFPYLFLKNLATLVKDLKNTAAEGHNYYNLNVLRKPDLDKSAWVWITSSCFISSNHTASWGKGGGGGERYGRSGEGGAGGKRRKCVSLFVFVLPVYGLPMCQLINYQSCGQHNSGKGWKHVFSWNLLKNYFTPTLDISDKYSGCQDWSNKDLRKNCFFMWTLPYKKNPWSQLDHQLKLRNFTGNKVDLISLWKMI